MKKQARGFTTKRANQTKHSDVLFVSERRVQNHSNGFTLIELLVVIAIIGILSAVVLASLSTARTKGSDAAIQSDMHTIVTQAEIYYGNNANKYATTTVSGACSTLNTQMFSDNNIKNALAGAKTDASGTDGDCAVTTTAYSVAVPLATANTFWCIDSTGVSRGKTSTGTTYNALTGTGTAAHASVGSTVCQ